MTSAGRRRTLVLGVGALAVVLVGGRWLALETAERIWASTVSGGAAYLSTRDFARLVSGLLLLAAVAWGTANLLFVYRSIGSMQLSRRLGDLEIVEAVPQPLLLAGTIACGLVFGFLLTLGTGDWWMQAALASRAPRFGVADPVLHLDIGYYVARLPWMERLRELALLAVCAATAVVALLYGGIGSLKIRRWLPYANAHARAHLGLLLALLALTLTWGALLDPAETVAGLNGVLTQRALDLRLPAAPVVAGVGLATAVASLIWGLRERPILLVSAWATLLVASLAGFTVIPGPLPDTMTDLGGHGVRDSALAADQQRLEALAFGAGQQAEHAPPGFTSPAAAAAGLPIWDARRVLVAAAARRDLAVGPRTPATAALTPHPLADGRPSWIVAFRPAPDSETGRQPPDWTALHRAAWARAGPPVVAVEADTLLEFVPAATRDSATWFGLGFTDFAVAAPDTWPALRRAGVVLTGWWRRTALAWALQSPALARRETDGLLLLWRRDVAGRVQRLAPFATFDDPVPIVADSTLWWVTYGYLAAEAFPLVRAVPLDGRSLRYLRAGLVAVVNATSGDTRVYLAPGADSLANAWADLITPLIRPLDSLPAAVRAQLPFPRHAFRAVAALLERWRAGTHPWVPRPREPFELVAPGGDGAPASVWTAQGFEAGSTFATLVAGAMAPAGPQLVVWRPTPPVRLPAVLLGSPTTTAPGVFRLWNAAGTLVSKQALFVEASAGGPASGIDTLFLTWGDRHGQGRDAAAALRELLGTAGAPLPPSDTTLAARWQRAQRVVAQADSALAAGDLEAFARLYRQLQELLAPGRRKLAPTPERR